MVLTMGERDEDIGRNLAQLRGDRTQQEIAEAMRSMGYKWSQATVWSVEKGERPLRLSEAMDVARVLDVDISDLFSTEQESVFRSALREMGQARKRLEEAAASYENHQIILAVAAGLFPGADRYEAKIREWLNLSVFRAVQGVLAGGQLASGALQFAKDPLTGEVAGRGPWVDELVAAWENEQQGRVDGEHKEEA